MQFFVNKNYMVKFKTKDEEDVVEIYPYGIILFSNEVVSLQ